MKWLHLSDIHFNPSKDGADSIYLRNRLLEFLRQKNISVDKIFITGDFRDASCQKGTDVAAKDIANYILGLANIVGIKNKDILMVPGNHDLTRNFIHRQEVVTKNKTDYKPENGVFSSLDILVESFEFYQKVIAHINGNDYAYNMFDNVYKFNPHSFIMADDINILQLNTELLAGEVVEQEGRKRVLDEGMLSVGTKYVINALSLMESSKKPIIVLAHRGLDLLNSFERKKLSHIFEDFNVCIYLCGHSHDLWCDESYGIPQITVGCIKQQDGVKVGFTIGEYSETNKSITIEAFSWENDRWGEYNHFCSKGHRMAWDVSNKIVLDEDEYRNKIKIVLNGVLREFCGRSICMKHGIDNGPIMSTIAGSLIFEIRNNEFTREIRFNDKFILSQCVWRIIGIDDTARLTTTVTCEKVLMNPHEDDMENGIANKSQIRNEV